MSRAHWVFYISHFLYFRLSFRVRKLGGGGGVGGGGVGGGDSHQRMRIIILEFKG